MDIINNYEKALQSHSRNLPVVFKCVLVGLLVSFISILYRLALTKADEVNNIFYAYIRQHNNLIIPMVVLLAMMGWLIGMLIRKFPMTSGSGIPQVKGQILGYFKNPWISTLIVKFIGVLDNVTLKFASDLKHIILNLENKNSLMLQILCAYWL